MNGISADQAAWMHRIGCAFVVRLHQNQGFSGRGPRGGNHIVLNILQNGEKSKRGGVL